MKKLSLILASFALVTSTQAAVLFYDAFSYADGNIVTNSGGAWTNHSGVNGDSLVASGKYQIDQGRTDDVNRQFVNAGTWVCASFTVNFSSLPSTANGTYFAHFKDTTFSNLFGRVFAMTTNTVLPGTVRIGIANTAGSASVIFPVDLATNTDYQIVFQAEGVVSGAVGAQLWINPGASNDITVVASDAPSITPTLSASGWRQSTGEGVMTVDNLLVGNSFTEVVTNVAAAPTIVRNPLGTTNFAGNDTTLNGLATATSIGTLAYQWLKNGAAIGGATSNILALSNLAGADAGSYTLVASNANGSVTSSVAYVEVNTTPTAPQILAQPVSVTNFVGSTISFSVTAQGTGPLYYQWKTNSVVLSGATSSTLTIAGIGAQNAGTYFCVVSNSIGTSNSANATLTVLPPILTNICYLRTLQIASNSSGTIVWVPTNTTTLYRVIGTVTTHTNITSSGNASFHMQDGECGIPVFFGGASTVRPNAGDIVEVTGALGVFNTSLMQMALTTANPNHAVTILSSNNPMPAARVFSDYSLPTNDLQFMEHFVEGGLVTLYNITFTNLGNFGGGVNYNVFNELGERIAIRIDSRVFDIIGKPIPATAYQLTGVMGSAFINTNPFQIFPTRYVDIVTNLPPSPVVTADKSGSGVTLSWTNTIGSTYSIYRSTNLADVTFPPYDASDGMDPSYRLKSGLNFLGTNATYSETNAPGGYLYRVTSP